MNKVDLNLAPVFFYLVQFKIIQTFVYYLKEKPMACERLLVTKGQAIMVVKWTQVSRLDLQPTLCLTETPELESSALDLTATTHKSIDVDK